MDYEFLLNKEDRRSYNLLKYLERSVTLTESLSKLQEELELSPFLVKKTIDNLKSDISDWDLSESFKLSTENVEIILEINGDYTSNYVLSKYIKQSLSTALLISIFSREFTSLEDFMEEHHVSYSVAYKTIKRLQKELNYYNITLEKGKMIGSRTNILFFMYHLFLLINPSFEDVYEQKIISEVEQIMDSLQQMFVFSNYEKQKLFHCLALGKIENTREEINIKDEIVHFFDEAETLRLKQTLSLRSINYTYYLLAWLYSYNKLDDSYINRNEDSKIQLLNQLFVNKVEKNFTRLAPAIKSELLKGLERVHFTSKYYPIEKFNRIEIDTQFFYQTYPEFYLFLLEYTKNIIDEFSDFSRNKSILFFNYLMLLIHTVPVDHLKVPVKIGIDFSYGELYNEFIKKNLAMYVNLNVAIIDPNLHHEADIVITNMNDVYDSESTNVIVWLDPPRVVDWANLTKKILELQTGDEADLIDSV
ncbi:MULTISPECIES: helix-turn-helix domain-containing protein [unclassified Enterococcus]|uniref:helix-turn-helix domain-containing protein n=1 Tax=unclassified Enterococcus TaxID=2608891 RepID=UPI001A931E05|nr:MULTISPECIES: helix-turn-helix domain-containing protein [unclassified Enterococcus]MBO0462414.1 helix-turn-helix domain-containing protein [Enterococcus sp. DIV1298c]MBO1300642.1 helix-turn-helix domain-containing protein [Enterococcus sp. DIV1271a]